ncbi:MAG: LysR family transcriptional regulator [Erysipelotrichaceae bacterium]|nr:LysR family transcriptional regulator [Erysipelotrichaceae bacterium]
MELRQMNYFKTIVDEGTISKAARKLHMAQPPLSIQLKALEEEIGQPLLIRGHKSVKLTPAGRLFYKRCQQVLSLCELTISELEDLSTQTLRIGITSSNSTLLQQHRIVQFIRSHPKLNVRIKEGTSVEMVDALRSHDIDIGLLRTPFNDHGLDIIYLDKEPMVVVGPNHLVNPDKNHLIDYKDQPLIVHRRYNRLIINYCHSLDFSPNIHILSDDCRTAITWASLLESVALIPKSVVPVSDTELAHVDLMDTELDTYVAVATRKDDNLSPIVQTIISDFKRQDTVQPEPL